MTVATATPQKANWSPPEREAWTPQPLLTPSEWAQEHRRLSRAQSPRSGPWENEQAPYLAGLMDLCVREGVHEITIRKAAQVGVSEAMRNVIGYFASHEPDPVMLTLPTEKKGRQIVGRRLIPMFRETRVLRQLLVGDAEELQLGQIILRNGFSLVLAWAGSPTSLASDPIRVCINDEVEKYPTTSGKESDPVSLARDRTRVYGDQRLVVNTSTPTTEGGMITRLWKSATIHLDYHVPCPRCGHFQPLTFDRLIWEKPKRKLQPNQLAAWIQDKGKVRYQCARCRHKIDQAKKGQMVRAGRWLSKNQRIDADGKLLGQWPVGTHVGVQLSALPCLWVTWEDIVASFIMARGNPMATMTFRNQTLGEPFEQQISHTRPSVFLEKSRQGHRAGVLPPWTGVLLATADTQQDHFYFGIRAWGPGFISRRIDHGVVGSFAELKARCLEASFGFSEKSWAPLKPSMLLIDSGGTGLACGASRTSEVYQFALTDPGRIKAIKGMSRPSGIPVRTSYIAYNPPHRPGTTLKLMLYLLDTHYFKELLTARILATEEIPQDTNVAKLQKSDAWQLSDVDDPEYSRQMASEQKVIVRQGAGGPKEVWQPITENAANHYWDVEVYQMAAAHMAAVATLPAVQHVIHQRQHFAAQATRPRRKTQRGRGTVSMPDGRPFLATQR